MTCDIGRLIAYRDGMLAPQERQRLGDHLAGCADCRAALRDLEDRAERVGAALARRAPDGWSEPDRADAWRRLTTALPARTARLPQSDQRRWTMQRTRSSSPRARLALAAVLAVVVVAALAAFAPARRAAADFLAVFRVQRLQVVPVASEGLAQLEELEQALEGGMLGEPTVLREPGEPVDVADAVEASALAGFPVRTVAELPEDTRLIDTTVASGPLLRFDIPRETAELALLAVGATDIILPPVDAFSAEVDIPTGVQQTYAVEGQTVQVFQLPSPTVTLPPGVPADRLGQAFLQLLGLTPADAERLAGDIDWTSTLVIPVPTDHADYQEVSVRGAPAVVLRERHRSGRANAASVLWQQDGMLYGVSTTDGVATSLLVRLAEALR